jgi:hypothetical protein
MFADIMLTRFEIGKEPLQIVRRMAELGITLVCFLSTRINDHQSDGHYQLLAPRCL